MVSWMWKSSEIKNLNILHEFNSDQTRHTGCLKKKSFTKLGIADSIVAKGVKISTDQFVPPKISTKKAPVFRLFSRVFACFRVFSPVFRVLFPKISTGQKK